MTAKTKRLPGVARIGIGGPVGSGKTALVERLIPVFKTRNIEVGVVANDIVTQEDAERIKRSGLIDPGRVLAVETGACPHTAIREDPTLNIQAVEALVEAFPELEVVLVEFGGTTSHRHSRTSLSTIGCSSSTPQAAMTSHASVGSAS